MAIAATLLALTAVSCRGSGPPPADTADTSAESPVSTRQTSDETAQAIAAAGQRAEPAGLGDPMVVELPAVADGTTAVWLNGDGAALSDAVTASSPLWSEGQASCADVSGQLDTLGPPDTLVGLAAQTPDEPTRELLLGLLTVIGDTLATCNDPEAFNNSAAELAWQWALTERRLVELGVHQ